MSTDDIWELAKGNAQTDFFNAPRGYEFDFNCDNPFEKGTYEYGEYEAAYEHYIMSALGY